MELKAAQQKNETESSMKTERTQELKQWKVKNDIMNTATSNTMRVFFPQTKSHLLSIFINTKIPQAQTTYVTVSRLSEKPTFMRCNIFPVQNINNLLLVLLFLFERVI